MSSSSDGATWTCGRCGRVSDLLVVRCPRCGFVNPIALVDDYGGDTHQTADDPYAHAAPAASPPSPDPSPVRSEPTRDVPIRRTGERIDASIILIALILMLLVGSVITNVIWHYDVTQLRTAVAAAAQYRSDCDATAAAMAQDQAAGTPMTTPDPTLACHYWTCTATLQPSTDKDSPPWAFNIAPDYGPSYQMPVILSGPPPDTRTGSAMVEEWNHQTTAVIYQSVRYSTPDNPIYIADTQGNQVRSSKGVAITTTVLLIVAIIGYTVRLYRQVSAA